jgi:hypothetical protein
MRVSASAFAARHLARMGRVRSNPVAPTIEHVIATSIRRSPLIHERRKVGL